MQNGDGYYFRPSDEAELPSSWVTAFRSERDLSINIPINFLTKPGATLSTACFSDREYLASTGATCFSNLLASGFRRFVFDVYWDPSRRQWSLCPVRLPLEAVNPFTRTSRPPGSTPFASLSSVQLDDVAQEVNERPEGATDEGRKLVARQTPSSASAGESSYGGRRPSASRSASASSDVVQGAAVTSSASGATPTPSRDPMTEQEIYHVDGYDCTADLTLQFMGQVLEQYLHNTSNTLEADVSFLTINVHAARDPDGSDDGPAVLTGPDLPAVNESLTTALHADLRPFLYSPPMLAQERENLNNSWLALPAGGQPDWAYMTIQEASPGVAMTPDGWPSEYVIVFTRAMRLFVGLGTVDPQMENYDLTLDQDTVFPPNYIRASRDTAFSAGGSLSEGCFFDAAVTGIGATNHSWAVSPTFPSAEFNAHPNVSMPIVAAISNLTACGISPLLNATLAGASAADDPIPYRRLALSTSWSWVPGILDNDTTATNLTTGDTAGPTLPTSSNADTPLRCAVLSLAHGGRWLPVACDATHRAACRVGNAPHRWLVTRSEHSFDSAFDACADVDPDDGTDAAFDVPRTALDNAYLYAVARGMPSGSGEGKDARPEDDRVWLAFNSVDRADCWVVGATSVTCPYVEQDADVSVTVIIPAVASVIILLVTALTVFVKCGANRRLKRTVGRRRKEDGLGEYEGVPS